MIGERLRTYRRHAGLTQKEFGLALGYKETTAEKVVQQWEYGNQPIPAKYWRNISRILNMPMDELIP